MKTFTELIILVQYSHNLFSMVNNKFMNEYYINNDRLNSGISVDLPSYCLDLLAQGLLSTTFFGKLS